MYKSFSFFANCYLPVPFETLNFDEPKRPEYEDRCQYAMPDKK